MCVCWTLRSSAYAIRKHAEPSVNDSFCLTGSDTSCGSGQQCLSPNRLLRCVFCYCDHLYIKCSLKTKN